MVSGDRHSTYAGVALEQARSLKQFNAVRELLDAPGLQTQLGGIVAISAEVGQRAADDLGRAETYSMPIVLLLLVIVFRSLVAATTPLLVGALAILGALTVVRVLTYLTDVTVFALRLGPTGGLRDAASRTLRWARL